MNNRKVVLDTAQCTGCMSCVAACPQDALVSDHGLDELLSALQTGKDVVVSCIHQAQQHPDGITIPCVGILSKQVLAAILLSDCRTVTFDLIGCAGCCNRSVSSTFLADCKLISEELSAVNSARLVLVEKREQRSNPGMDRRSYLTELRNIAVDVSKQRFMPNQVAPLSDSKSRRRIPFNTYLVKKVLSDLQGDSRTKILDLFGYNLSINADCNCCPLCKGICPTGAIKIDRSDQGKSLRFDMLDCSGCGLCVEFCKNNALSLERLSLEIS